MTSSATWVKEAAAQNEAKRRGDQADSILHRMQVSIAGSCSELNVSAALPILKCYDTMGAVRRSKCERGEGKQVHKIPFWVDIMTQGRLSCILTVQRIWVKERELVAYLQ